MTVPLRVGLVVNPTSGRGRALGAADLVEQRLTAAGRTVERIQGCDGPDAERLCLAAVAGGVDALVAVGGDGMAHLALQACAGTSTPLGIVPTGTGNDLARALDLPLNDPIASADLLLAGTVRSVDAVRSGDVWWACVLGTGFDGAVNDPIASADLLLAGTVRSVDAVRSGDVWWACVLGTGFDGAVNDRANRMRWPRGRRRYDLAVVAELRSYRPGRFVLELDGVRSEHDAMLVALGNAPSYGGGMKVCPGAVMDDGLLDVVVVGPLSRTRFLRLFPRVFAGQHVTDPSVTVHRAREVTLDGPGWATAYADGERLGGLPLTCTVVPRALHVIGVPGLPATSSDPAGT